MGFYSEENCQIEAHEPLLDWASGRKAPVMTRGIAGSQVSGSFGYFKKLDYTKQRCVPLETCSSTEFAMHSSSE